MPQTVYLVTWLAAVLASCGLVARGGGDRVWLTDARYLRFLVEPWKLVAFALSGTLITLVAPYSGDPTWDRVDGALISLTVYWASPWAIATLVREARGRRRGDVLFVATSALLLPCWVYDGYILLRDSFYPATWTSNLVLSGAICVVAGLFWNLGASDGERSNFTFLRKSWPPTQRTPLRKVLPFAVVLALPVLIAVLAFVYLYLYG